MKIKTSICDSCGQLIGKPGGFAVLHRDECTHDITEFCNECFGDEKKRYMEMKKKTIENLSDEMRAKVEANV